MDKNFGITLNDIIPHDHLQGKEWEKFKNMIQMSTINNAKQTHVVMSSNHDLGKIKNEK